jgi:hypothetical protein
MDPPGFQLHWWTDGGGLVTHTAHTGDYGEPIRFPW